MVSHQQLANGEEEEGRNLTMITMKIGCTNQDRLIPKRGRVKAGIVLALAHSLVAFFSVKYCLHTGSPHHFH